MTFKNYTAGDFVGNISEETVVAIIETKDGRQQPAGLVAAASDCGGYCHSDHIVTGCRAFTAWSTGCPEVQQLPG